MCIVAGQNDIIYYVDTMKSLKHKLSSLLLIFMVGKLIEISSGKDSNRDLVSGSSVLILFAFLIFHMISQIFFSFFCHLELGMRVYI